MNRKALVAMSGGVDSSVAAYLVREAGYETTGATMRLFDNETIGLPSDKTCCSLSSIEDACAVANRLGIYFLVFDFRADFRREVIDRFIAAYEAGRTPNPCIECNRYLKFEQLYTCGQEIGMDCIATGHYARIERDTGAGRYLLRKAADLSKDQSYVLYSLTQEQLARTLFPLGGMTKQEVRALAEDLGLVTAYKGESQDICFVPDGDYAGFIRNYTGHEYPPGDFVGLDGTVLGTHKGIIHYTIGQRKGLGLALKKPMYVSEIDTVNNRVVLADNADLFTRELTAADFNWIACDVPSSDLRASARIRYKHKEAPATVIPTGRDTVKVIFDEPQRAVTRGQSVVLYDGDVVIGGGTIV
ncbi:MAG: tRNA 2-thiouridine(34) synthase MnmA [Mogibacterium sp.]|nr:tRNA 2-thiouridine(34) synthase MnmA [Mogibacterium sp.]